MITSLVLGTKPECNKFVIQVRHFSAKFNHLPKILVLGKALSYAQSSVFYLQI